MAGEPELIAANWKPLGQYPTSQQGHWRKFQLFLHVSVKCGDHLLPCFNAHPPNYQSFQCSSLYSSNTQILKFSPRFLVPFFFSLKGIGNEWQMPQWHQMKVGWRLNTSCKATACWAATLESREWAWKECWYSRELWFWSGTPFPAAITVPVPLQAHSALIPWG